MKTLRPLAAALVLGGLLATLAPPAPAAARFPVDKSLAPMKQTQQRAMFEKMWARREAAKLEMKLRAKGKGRGLTARRAPTEGLSENERLDREARATKARRLFEANNTALAPNVRANNPASDVFPAQSTQSEASIAVWKNYVVVAWNDEDGYDRAAPSDDVLGYAVSTDYGATFTDGGAPPKRTNWRYISDPVLTVNEKTGDFFLTDLVDSTDVYNGLAVIKGSFAGNVFTWSPASVTRMTSKAANFLDKPWIAADSASDSVYVIYTNFSATGGHIEFQRSPNGVNWVPSVGRISSLTGENRVTGARVACGPNGEVYAIWSEIGTVDVDFFRIRQSNNAGATWGSERTAASYYDNYGTGSPAFNRRRGIAFPSIAVDRSTGPARGRVYVTWNESVNYYDDGNNYIPTGQNFEPGTEPHTNDTPGTAKAFTIGQTLHGGFVDVNDLDYWSFSGTQGQTILCVMDTVGAGARISLRLFCSDGTTTLAWSALSTGLQSLFAWTLPANGTYYVRTADVNGTSTRYTVLTMNVTPSAGDHARDHRDIMVSYADNIASWTGPVRVNNDPAYYDDYLPEIAVDGKNGRPYVMWLDWRDTPAAQCGGWSNIYLARSDNNGASWTEVGSVTNVSTDWTNTFSTFEPNQGDYLHFAADTGAVYPVWADGRDGNPNVYVSRITLQTTPTLLSLVSAEAQPGRVSLRWYASGSEGLVATVYRRDAGAAGADDGWTALAQLPVPGNGALDYVDTGVEPGRGYEYRLGIVEDGAETFAGFALVSVPLRPEFGVEGVTPNPTRDAMNVTFTLPNASAARLALYDIAGRQVLERDVTALGAGRHVVSLRPDRALAMGIYILQLEQAGKRATTRVSVVR